MRQNRVINADDQFLEFTPAGEFLVLISGTIGSNVVRVLYLDPNSGSWVQATDAGTAIALSTVGTHKINNPGTMAKVRVGCPAADFASGSFNLSVDYK